MNPVQADVLAADAALTLAQRSVDLRQAHRLLSALYLDHDWIHLQAITEKNTTDIYAPWIQEQIRQRGRFRRLAFFKGSQGTFYLDKLRVHLDSFLNTWNGDERMQVMASVGVFQRYEARKEYLCSGLSALALDVDPDDFPKLVSGATTIEAVIPEVLARLAQYEIRPHAIISTGNGFHVYILIERLALSTDADLRAAKEVWYRLSQLLEAPDRCDLASMMRVPGSWNWKGGVPRLVHFIEEYTDLNRPRYRFEDLALRLRELPALPAEKHPCRSRPGFMGATGAAPGRVRRAGSGDQIGVAEPPTGWSKHLLSVCVALSPKLGQLQHRSRFGAPGARQDRSRADYLYGLELVRLGFTHAEIASEIGQSLKGIEEGSGYSKSRTWGVLAASIDAKCSGVSTAITYTDTAIKSAYLIKEWLNKKRQVDAAPSPLSSPGAKESEASKAVPVVIVAARPGLGKTRGILHVLGQETSLGGRVGICTAFKTEMLAAESSINAGWGCGLWQETADGDVVEPQGPALTHEQLWERLPTNIKERWNVERFKAVVKNPLAFAINARHPQDQDERIRSMEPDDEDLSINPGATGDICLQPRCVAKFSASASLCLAGHSKQTLASDFNTCRRCEFVACRSNQNQEKGASARSYWTDAPFALLSHSSYQTQLMHRPAANDFGAVIFDELPQTVYRTPEISVRCRKEWRGNWSVKPVDQIIGYIEARLENEDQQFLAPFVRGLGRDRDALAELLPVLVAAKKSLIKQASALRSAARHPTTGTRVYPHVRAALNFRPLLSARQFQDLLRAAKPIMNACPDDDEPNDRSNFTAALSILRGFSSDEPALPVLLSHNFTQKRRHGQLTIMRPVNGWADLLNDRHGQARPTIILDATAGQDPRYLLMADNREERYPAARFPGTTIVLTRKRGSRSAKAVHKAMEKDAAAFARTIADDLKPYLKDLATGEVFTWNAAHTCVSVRKRPPKLLIITDKKSARELRREIRALVRRHLLPKKTTVVHFGSLRGRNDFDDYDGVYFTHLHRHPAHDYLGQAILLGDWKDVPKEFAPEFDLQQGNKERKQPRNPTWRMAELIRHRAMSCDLYQDALRIGIRRDPERRAHIFVPTAEVQFVARLLHQFQDATLVTKKGVVHRAERPDTEDWDPSDLEFEASVAEVH